MTDEPKPLPRYGEYATPQDQARAMGLTHPAPPDLPASTDDVRTPGRSEQEPVVAARVERKSRINRFLTIALLVFGLLNVLASAPGYLQLPKTLQGVYDQLGLGTYTATATASTLGVIAVVVQSVLWLVTAAISMLLLRKGRTAWWVPLTGGGVSVIALMAIIYLAMLGDPAMAGYIGSGG